MQKSLGQGGGANCQLGGLKFALKRGRQALMGGGQPLHRVWSLPTPYLTALFSSVSVYVKQTENQ